MKKAKRTAKKRVRKMPPSETRTGKLPSEPHGIDKGKRPKKIWVEN